MKIAVVGASGTLGTAVIRAASVAGHQVTAIVRTSLLHPPARITVRRADVLSGKGLREALAGAEVVVDAVNIAKSSLACASTRAILAEAATLGVRHYVGVSVVGCDRVPSDYLRAKLEQEKLVAASPVPWSLLRATQFHEFLDKILTKLGTLGLYVIPPAAKLQPVAADEVAAALLEAATSAPSGRLPDFAGPEILRADELYERWRQARQRRGIMLPIPTLGALLFAFAQGAACNPDRAVGRQTFAQWLRRRIAPSGGVAKTDYFGA